MVFLIEFEYDHYCQGYEKAWTTVLVRSATSFENACWQIENCNEFKNPKYFRDKTISND